jgi:glycosyltransferase involved in cell wall biosynthesis
VGEVTDVEPYLRAADVFVLPSRDEGMSIALLEAMAVGLPAVASDIPGNRAVVEPGRTGWLVPVDDAAALAAALTTAFTDAGGSMAVGAAAREAVARQWSIERMAAEHVALFQRLCRR